MDASFSSAGGIMYFDWITWSIWLLGLIILIIWVYVPYKEFRKLLADRKKSLIMHKRED